MTLAILKVETTCNTSDRVLVQNLEATKARGTIPVPFSTENLPPLFICGSGPSLLRYLPAALAMYPDAHIMAMNGAYKALLGEGIAANYFIQLDAKVENVNFVEKIDKKTVFILASQCDPSMFGVLNDAVVQTFHLNTPTTRRVFPNERIYFGGGTTVGSTAMGVGAWMGYRHLCLLGYDSSYDGERSHIIPQPQNANQATLDVWVEDRRYITTANMAKQVEDFRPWCAALEKVFKGIDIRLFGDGLLYDYIQTGQRNEATRESEAAKYEEMYKDPTYRMPEHRAAAIRKILEDRPRGSLLDVGTGRGETLSLALALGYAVHGTETVDDLCNENTTKALLPNLPFKDKSYDTVTNFEVIEHLLPSDVVPALRELERLARDRVIISAATRSDVRGGVELHPSYRSEEEWMGTFKAAWGVEADVKLIGNLSSCGLSPVYEYRLRTT